MNTTRYLCSCIWAILGILAGHALAQPSFYHHGNIYTMDASRPRAEAMLVEDGLFVAVGSEAQVRQYLRDAGIRVIHNVDLKGQTVVPGLIDAHGHMTKLGALGAKSTPEELILNAQQKCLRVGLTGVHDAGVSAAEIEVYKKLQQEGQLKIRIYAMVHAEEAPAWFAEHGTYDGFKLTVRAAKAYMDGAIGSRDAWLLKPYADRPSGPDGKPYIGLPQGSTNAIETLALDGLRNGYQICTHAIGDRANREVLDAYENALKQVGKEDEGASLIADHRFRIEHAQLLTQDDIPRFGELGVIASMQPTHCTSDMRWVDARVGTERAKGAYAWASLLQSGATLALGSDFPVESPNPFLGIYAAVTRENAKGEPTNGWHPEQRLTREEALRGFTIDAAKAAFWDERVGSIKAGKLADFVILDRDIMTCDVEAIVGTKVLKTVSFGEVVYKARQ